MTDPIVAVAILVLPVGIAIGWYYGAAAERGKRPMVGTITDVNPKESSITVSWGDYPGGKLSVGERVVIPPP